MNAFEYLSVLISIILALGMTRALAGVSEMLQARSHRRLYWVHAIWIVNLFLYLVIAWWIFYRWRNQQPWTFYLFVSARKRCRSRHRLQDALLRESSRVLHPFRAVYACRYC